MEGLMREHRGNQHGPLYRPSMTSTYDSAENIATLPESDLDDEQIRTMLASPLYLQEREASADRSRVYLSLLKRKLSVKFTSLLREHGETRGEGEYGETRCAVFETKGSRVKKHFPAEKIFPKNVNRF